jgi:AraC-like DNA-binding protein
MSPNINYRLLQARWASEVVEVTRASFAADAFAPHFHDGLAIGLVRHGVNVFCSGGKRVEVEAGSLCIVNAGEVHDGGLSGHPWSYDNLHLPWPLLAAIASELGVAPELDNCRIDDPECVQAAKAFFSLAHDVPSNDDLLQEAGFGLLDALLRRHAVTWRRPSESEPSIATRTFEALGDLTDLRITLTDLERILGFSRFQIIRAVQARYGLTPHQLQLQFRVARARALVLSGTTIADAALACGFADQAHLTREMKRRWGASPGLMRRHTT